ncbi:ubiquinone biosynthesis methyltransferase coq5 protein [Rutstroemia sp. NJR-2017a WRK4]|nr:ubiquinone biosynthesis methyltransferase coq5 protein [Rutstroemia sp. NJR-2017a WRK4]
MACRTYLRPLTRSLKPQISFPISQRSFTQTVQKRAGESPSQPQTQSQATNHERTTHFGFETVPEAEKEARVAGVFSNVAASYDAMNDFMSLGIHRLWKDHFVRSINPGFTPPSTTTSSQNGSTPAPGWKMLDIAGGTGDIAFRLLDHATNINHSPSSSITISDINPSMLSEGRKRSLSTPYAHSPRLSFLLANAESLTTIPSNSIDLYTVAFGIRNFTNKDAALREAYRVLKPGGLFACLEFSGVRNPLFNAVYKRWSFGAIPLIGQLVAGDRDSYQYLVESIEKFPRQEEWRDMIKEAGFVVPGQGWEDLTGGIAAIHKGIKPLES